MGAIEHSGSVRIDLVGGTLDLAPINLILNNVVTINMATNIKAKVLIKPIDYEGIEIHSADLELLRKFTFSEFNSNNLNSGHFGELTFLASIIHYFNPNKGLSIDLSSGSPPGGGLGGSSTMGLTLFKALCEYLEVAFDRDKAIKIIKDIESVILNSGPTGYQDYYPCVYGGVLALKPKMGEVGIEQFYSPELRKYLESHLTLVYSGVTRFSGINNWEVYKNFFDEPDQRTRKLLQTMADLSMETYQAIKKKNFSKITGLASQEGELRKKLFPGIVPKSTEELYHSLRKKLPHLGMKMCGAGGGGCYLLFHGPGEREIIQNYLRELEAKDKVLEFTIEKNII